MNVLSRLRLFGVISISMLLASACSGPANDEVIIEQAPEAPEAPAEVAPRPDIYAEVALVSDLSGLSNGQKEMLVLMIRASQIMDDLFWRQSFGDGYQEWLAGIGVDEQRRFAELNYGPWDRLNDDKPFMPGFGPKPLGATFYPVDMTREEFEAADLPDKTGLYSFVRR
ncbi:MAG: hypothetical protein RLN69_07160, partial [Woeseiaceae bacterium]